VEKQFDDEGFPTRPRDYTRGIFKGGHDAASLFRRIAYGMPGTPMPGASKATPQERGDLVHFIRSLSDEATREDAVIKRRQLIVQRVKRVPGNEPRDWAGIVPADLQMIPLWWRDNADPGLQIQAVHDGQTIAIRLCWHDKTDDHEAVKGDSFEDAVAVALYHGNAEPFIGMGAPEAPVDIWFWDADRQTATVIEEAYPNMVVDRYPLSESTVDTAAFDRPGTRTTSQPPISLPAHASGNPIAPAAPGSGSSSLSAAGPGTVAFQNPRGRVIQARGHWQNGRWSILLARSLQPGSPADRVILEPGRRVSVAIAIWDGSQRERNGKKLVTIWNDLELEK
jgi:DMSO reductase family type II enzyme heme b subunit